MKSGIKPRFTCSYKFIIMLIMHSGKLSITRKKAFKLTCHGTSIPRNNYILALFVSKITMHDNHFHSSTDFVNIFGISINFSGMRASWACFSFGIARYPPCGHLRSLCQHGTLEPIKAELPDLARFLLPQMKQHLWLGWKDTPPVSHSLIGQTSINLSQGELRALPVGSRYTSWLSAPRQLWRVLQKIW